MSISARRFQRVNVNFSSPIGEITHGSQINTSNTGITGAGISRASLTVSGGRTYSTAGQIISGLLFTDTVVLNADNIILRNCQVETNGENTKGIVINGSNCTVEYTTVVPPSSSTYMCIEVGGNNAIVRRVNASISENIITIGASTVLVEECYLHDTSNLANPAAHQDVIEVYGGNDVTIRRCRLFMHADETAVINIAPWYGSDSSDNVVIEDNWIDGGNAHVLVDLQSSGHINGTKVLRNIMGGHTNASYGRYASLQNNDGRATVETVSAQLATPGSILWPTNGADVNHWGDCADLVPNRTGQIILS